MNNYTTIYCLTVISIVAIVVTQSIDVLGIWLLYGIYKIMKES